MHTSRLAENLTDFIFQFFFAHHHCLPKGHSSFLADSWTLQTTSNLQTQRRGSFMAATAVVAGAADVTNFFPVYMETCLLFHLIFLVDISGRRMIYD